MLNCERVGSLANRSIPRGGSRVPDNVPIEQKNAAGCNHDYHKREPVGHDSSAKLQLPVSIQSGDVVLLVPSERSTWVDGEVCRMGEMRCVVRLG